MQMKSLSNLYNSYREISLDETRLFYHDSIVQERSFGDEAMLGGFDVVTDAKFGRLEGEPIALPDREHRGFFSLGVPGEILADLSGRPHLPFEQVLDPEATDILFETVLRVVHSSVCCGVRPDCLGIIPCGELSWSELPSHRPLLTMKVESNPYLVKNFLLYADSDLGLAPGIESVFHSFKMPCYDTDVVVLDLDRLATIMHVAPGQLLHCISASLEAYRLQLAV